MIAIYTVPSSLYCAKLRILLRYKSLAFEELAPPGGYASDEYRRIVPSGNLPALVDGDLVLGDSEAIAEYLNELHPDPPMLPPDIRRRALCRQRSRFHDTRLEPAVRTLLPHIKRSQRDPVFVATQSEQLNRRLQQLATLLDQTHPASDAMLTLADCGLPVTLLWIKTLSQVFALHLQYPPAVQTESDRLARFDAVSRELAAYQPHINSYIQATI